MKFIGRNWFLEPSSERGEVVTALQCECYAAISRVVLTNKIRQNCDI